MQTAYPFAALLKSFSFMRWSLTSEAREKPKREKRVSRQRTNGEGNKEYQRMKSASIYVDKISNNHNWKRFCSTFDVSFIRSRTRCPSPMLLLLHQVQCFLSVRLFFFSPLRSTLPTLSLFVQDVILYLLKAKR